MAVAAHNWSRRRWVYRKLAIQEHKALDRPSRRWITSAVRDSLGGADCAMATRFRMRSQESCKRLIDAVLRRNLVHSAIGVLPTD